MSSLLKFAHDVSNKEFLFVIPNQVSLTVSEDLRTLKILSKIGVHTFAIDPSLATLQWGVNMYFPDTMDGNKGALQISSGQNCKFIPHTYTSDLYLNHNFLRKIQNFFVSYYTPTAQDTNNMQSKYNFIDPKLIKIYPNYICYYENDVRQDIMYEHILLSELIILAQKRGKFSHFGFKFDIDQNISCYNTPYFYYDKHIMIHINETFNKLRVVANDSTKRQREVDIVGFNYMHNRLSLITTDTPLTLYRTGSSSIYDNDNVTYVYVAHSLYDKIMGVLLNRHI